MESINIIVAESDTETAIKIEQVLVDMGHQVLAVVDSRKAVISQIEIKKPDLVLMDVRLIDNEDTTETGGIIYKQMGIPVIFLFGKEDQGLVDTAIQNSPFGCFPKPIQARDLILVVEIVKNASRIDAERRKAVEELSKSQEQLRVSNERLMIILDSVPADIYVSDMETFEILYMNAQMKESFGKDLTGQICYQAFRNDSVQCPHCNNSQLLDENGQPTATSIWEGYNPISDKNYLNYDRAIPWIDGKFVRIQVATDITDRKLAEAALTESEEKHRLFFENSPIGIIHYDDAGVITDLNEAMLDIFGSTYEDQIGSSVDEVNHREYADAIRKSLTGKYATFEGWYTPVYGEKTTFLQANWIPIERDGKVISGVGIVEDITERKRSRDLMIQTEKIMSVGGLAAGMAHEINNPLGSIMQSAQNIQRRMSPELEANLQAAEECGVDLENVQKYMERRNVMSFIQGIQESGSRAAKIISDMLQFSRKSESNMAPIDLHKLIKKTLGMAGQDFDLKKRYDFRNLNIKTSYDPKLPLVPCIETEIEQVMLNLLRNSAQALFEEPKNPNPVIEIRTSLEADNALIEVEDNGPGVTEDIKQRLFEPFYTTKPIGEGTGLGLSVSYMIVTANHSGSMEVTSIPGQGTTLSVRLPLVRPENGKR